MNNQLIIEKTRKYIEDKLKNDASGHDYWHVYRVWRNAILIGKSESVDMFVVELAALLHDIADWKLYNGDEEIGPKKAREWLESLKVGEKIISQICDIIRDMSFKGAGVNSKISTKEGEVVQDADRLDAIGAIGIARTFAYGGSKGREMHNPNIKPEMHHSFEQYKKNTSSTINHFYEKLFLLKNLMNTETAKRIAEERHKFMELYVDRFLKEWNGEL